ncbi:MAG: virulence factor [Planctomycetota bacterium]|nr:virulence factor [Planctomycetota bacterium]
MPTQIQVLSWKNIPTQVKAADEAGGEHSVPLDDRFQQAVDALAMDEGLAGTDEYLDHWNWSEPAGCEGAPQAAAEALAKELADGPTFGHAMTKTMLWQEWNSGLGECIEAEAQAQAICMQTKDF